MIEILPKSHDNIMGVKASGKVTDADYKEILIPGLDKIIQEHGNGNFLYYLSDEFEGFELGAMWDAAQYACSHADKFVKIAFVGGPKWMEWSVKMSEFFIKAEIKPFRDDQLDEAWNWIES